MDYETISDEEREARMARLMEWRRQEALISVYQCQGEVLSAEHLEQLIYKEYEAACAATIRKREMLEHALKVAALAGALPDEVDRT